MKGEAKESCLVGGQVIILRFGVNDFRVESIFEEMDRRRIAPQNFQAAIFACIVNIVFQYGYFFVFPDYRYPILLFSIASGVAVLVFFRVYLFNFSARGAVSWLNWYIGVGVATLLLYLLYYALRYMGADVAAPREVVIFLLRLRLFFNLVVVVGLGVALQRIPGDFIGLLRPMGLINVYVMPLLVIWEIGIIFSDSVKQLTGGGMLPVRLAATTIAAVPTIMLIVIFYRAMKYNHERGDI